VPVSDARTTPRFDAEEVVRAALTMMATGKPDGLVFLTADVEMSGPMGEFRGRDQLRAHLSDWREGLTDIEIDVQRLAVDGAAVFAGWHLAARHTGAVFLMEDMLFEATGRPLDLDITTELMFRGQQICSLRHTFDLEVLLRQLRPDTDG
jgi:hypothetical protein